MKVFVSWSGELSQKVAAILKERIPRIMQSVDIFYSDDDIMKGENWNSRITKELSECNFGIICLTPDNAGTPWINFEAGAITKELDAKATALTIGVKPSEINGPISRLQATRIDKDDFFKMIKTINNLLETPLSLEVLEDSFESNWEIIYTKISEAMKKGLEKHDKENKRLKADPSEILEELLRLTRKQEQLISSPEKLLPNDYIQNLMYKVELQKSNVIKLERLSEIIYGIDKLTDAILEDEETIDALVSVVKELIKITSKFKNGNKAKELNFRLQECLNKINKDNNESFYYLL